MPAMPDQNAAIQPNYFRADSQAQKQQYNIWLLFKIKHPVLTLAHTSKTKRQTQVHITSLFALYNKHRKKKKKQKVFQPKIEKWISTATY